MLPLVHTDRMEQRHDETDITGPEGGASASQENRSREFSAERLHRSRRDRMVAGVAGGLADYFDVDPTLVRIGFVVLTLVGGLAVPLYIAGWLLIPEEGGGPSMAEELLDRERAHWASSQGA